MKKQMKRTVYEAPVTERFQVELEGAIMGASIIVDEEHGVETTGHELGTTIDADEFGWNDTSIKDNQWN